MSKGRGLNDSLLISATHRPTLLPQLSKRFPLINVALKTNAYICPNYGHLTRNNYVDTSVVKV